MHNLSKIFVILASTHALLSCGKRETDSGASSDHVASVLKLSGESVNTGIGAATMLVQRQIQAALVRAARGLVREGEGDPNLKPQTTVTINDTTSTCPGGSGTSVTGGSADVSTATSGGTTTITFNDMDISSTFTDCVVQGDDSKDYTVDGTVNLTNVTGSYAVALSGVDATMTLPLTGTVTIAGESETKADCDLDITSTNTLSTGSGSLSGAVEWTGTACGISTSGSTSYTTSIPTFLLEL